MTLILLNDHALHGLKPEDSAVANTVEIRLDNVSQIFETMDPFPFRERDLAKQADDYISLQAGELPADQPFAIVIHLPAASAEQEAVRSLETSISNFFRYRAETVARELSELFQVGRRTLAIGLGVLATCLVISEVLGSLISSNRMTSFVEEGLIIVGWVALWRPLEIFLYDWWPVAQDAKLYRRLAAAPVSLKFHSESSAGR